MSENKTETDQMPTYWVGARPPYRVDYIDPAICATSTDQWFVMGTVDGDPRNPQGPVAICEYEPSAHAIAALLNATVDGHVVVVPSKTDARGRGPDCLPFCLGGWHETDCPHVVTPPEQRTP